MKALARNKQTIYYANRTEESPALDEYGLMTGEDETGYEEAQELRINTSPASGAIVLQAFGLTDQYDKVLVTDDLNCPLNETSHLWIGRETTEPFNYVVRRISKSLNSVVIALTQVDVTDAQDNTQRY